MLSLDMKNLKVNSKSKLKHAVTDYRHTYVQTDTHF